MKKTASFAAALLLMASAQHANAQQSVELYDKIGDAPVQTLQLSEVQSIRFGGPSLVIVTPVNIITGEYELKKVRKLTFQPSINTAINTASDKEQIVRKGNMIEISGMKSNTDVAIYSVNGQCLATKRWDGAGIDISSLRPGVYVLKVGNTTFKFNK